MSADSRLYRLASELCQDTANELAYSSSAQPGMPADVNLVVEFEDLMLLDLEIRKLRPSLTDAISADLSTAQAYVMDGLVAGDLSAPARAMLGSLSSRIGQFAETLRRPAGASKLPYYKDHMSRHPNFTSADVSFVQYFMSTASTYLRSAPQLPNFPLRMSGGSPDSVQIDMLFSHTGTTGFVPQVLSTAKRLAAEVLQATLHPGVDDECRKHLSKAHEKLAVAVAYKDRVSYATRQTQPSL